MPYLVRLGNETVFLEVLRFKPPILELLSFERFLIGVLKGLFYYYFRF